MDFYREVKSGIRETLGSATWSADEDGLAAEIATEFLGARGLAGLHRRRDAKGESIRIVSCVHYRIRDGSSAHPIDSFPMTQVDAQSFDYIIIGAGSAGCVVASRLSAEKDRSVLLLEAGGRDSHFLLRMPLGFLRAMFRRDSPGATSASRNRT